MSLPLSISPTTLPSLELIMNTLKLQYYQGVPVKTLSIISNSIWSQVLDYDELQLQIIHQILEPATDYKLTWTTLTESNVHLADSLRTELIDNFPTELITILPSPHYQQSFLKELISHLEQSNQEVHEFIITLYMRHIRQEFQDTQINTLGGESIHKKYYTTKLGLESFILTESRVMIGGGTTGLRTWQASLMLGRFLLDHPELVNELRVLELGSGVGFLGLILRQLHPNYITLTDYHPSVLKTLTLNLLLNQTNKVPVRVDSLDWNQVTKLQLIQPNIIIGADVTYDPEGIRPLVKLLHQFMTSSTTPCQAYIACTVRNLITFQFFLDLLKTKQPPLHYQLTNLSDLYMKPTTDDGYLYHFEDKISQVQLVQIYTAAN